MLGISEWAFIVFQSLVVASVIIITFPLADRLSDAWYNLKDKREKQKLLNKFNEDAKAYIENSESLTEKEN